MNSTFQRKNKIEEVRKNQGTSQVVNTVFHEMGFIYVGVFIYVYSVLSLAEDIETSHMEQ